MASYHNITDVYQRPFHSSMAKALIDGRTPAHVKHDIENGTKQTRSMFLGTMAHKILLQKDEFLEKWRRAPTEEKNGAERTINKNKDVYKQWKEKTIANGFVPYHIEELHKANDMIISLQSAPWIQDVLADPGHPELEVKATFHEFGLNVSIAIDWLKGSLICDLKKVRDGSPEGFGKSIGDYDYDLQASLYFDTLYRATDDNNIGFVWICVEEKPPHVVSCYYATEDHLMMGRDKYRRAMAIWSNCLKNKEFPGYQTTPQEPKMPYYYNRQAAELNY